MTTWVRILIAFIVFCHGFIYVRIGPVIPNTIKEWRGSSWLLGGLIADGPLTTLVIALHVIAGIVTLACAIAIGFAPSFPAWWRPLAIGSAVIGLMAFGVFWDGQTQMLLQEGVVGAIICLILLVSAIAFPQALR